MSLRAGAAKAEDWLAERSSFVFVKIERRASPLKTCGVIMLTRIIMIFMIFMIILTIMNAIKIIIMSIMMMTITRHDAYGKAAIL